MTGTYTRNIITILLFAAGFGHVCHSQTVVIDTSNFIKRVNIETHHKNESSKGKSFPGDFIFMPAELLKNDRWDTLNVRTRHSDSNDQSENGTIVLNNPNENPFVYPYKGKLLSPFGFRGHRIHAGVDIKLQHNDTVSCAFDGVVRMARVYGGYGNAVVVRHFNGLETLYGHLAKISVHVNDVVRAGDLIGLGGRTGRASTDHLHFEVRFQGEPFNPQRILDVISHSLVCDTLFISHETFNKSKYIANESSDKTLIVKSDEKNKTSKQKKSFASKEKKKFHIIHSGDTLSEIATKYGMTTTELCRLNGLKKNKLLSLGKKIRVI